jgi:thermostable 8-oxoguanine DNA glycosylase
VKIVKPLVRVLRLVDGEKLAMGYIYEAMDQAKKQTRAAYEDRVTKYGPIWEIIDHKWNNQLCRPIHAAGYFLNPRYHYKAQLGEDLTEEVRDGLYECLEHMAPSESETVGDTLTDHFFH